MDGEQCTRENSLNVAFPPCPLRSTRVWSPGRQVVTVLGVFQIFIEGSETGQGRLSPRFVNRRPNRSALWKGFYFHPAGVDAGQIRIAALLDVKGCSVHLSFKTFVCSSASKHQVTPQVR